MHLTQTHVASAGDGVLVIAVAGVPVASSACAP